MDPKNKFPGALNDDEIATQHESYALAAFSRRSGGRRRFFGSSLPDHSSYVTLAIKKCTRIQTPHGDRYYGSTRGDLIEIDLTASQFAELLTTANVGLGVPCTVRSFDGKRIEAPPETELEIEHVRKNFANVVKQAATGLKEARGAAEVILAKDRLTKADKAELLRAFDTACREITMNAPYTLEIFQEAADRVVTAAKAEIDAFATHNLISAGMTALAERQAAPELPPSKIDED